MKRWPRATLYQQVSVYILNLIPEKEMHDPMPLSNVCSNTCKMIKSWCYETLCYEISEWNLSWMPSIHIQKIEYNNSGVWRWFDVVETGLEYTTYPCDKRQTQNKEQYADCQSDKCSFLALHLSGEQIHNSTHQRLTHSKLKTSMHCLKKHYTIWWWRRDVESLSCIAMRGIQCQPVEFPHCSRRRSNAKLWIG